MDAFRGSFGGSKHPVAVYEIFYWHNSASGGYILYRYTCFGETVSTLTSSLQRTDSSRRASALAFALVNR